MWSGPPFPPGWDTVLHDAASPTTSSTGVADSPSLVGTALPSTSAPANPSFYVDVHVLKEVVLHAGMQRRRSYNFDENINTTTGGSGPPRLLGVRVYTSIRSMGNAPWALTTRGAFNLLIEA